MTTRGAFQEDPEILLVRAYSEDTGGSFFARTAGKETARGPTAARARPAVARHCGGVAKFLRGVDERRRILPLG